jgi:hypothetical protein
VGELAGAEGVALNWDELKSRINYVKACESRSDCRSTAQASTKHNWEFMVLPQGQTLGFWFRTDSIYVSIDYNGDEGPNADMDGSLEGDTIAIAINTTNAVERLSGEFCSGNMDINPWEVTYYCSDNRDAFLALMD